MFSEDNAVVPPQAPHLNLLLAHQLHPPGALRFAAPANRGCFGVGVGVGVGFLLLMFSEDNAAVPPQASHLILSLTRQLHPPGALRFAAPANRGCFALGAGPAILPTDIIRRLKNTKRAENTRRLKTIDSESAVSRSRSQCSYHCSWNLYKMSSYARVNRELRQWTRANNSRLGGRIQQAWQRLWPPNGSLFLALGYEEARLTIQKPEREIDLAAQHSIEKRRRDREGEQSSHASLTSDVMRRRPRRSRGDCGQGGR